MADKVVVIGDAILDEYICCQEDGGFWLIYLPGGAAHVADYLATEYLLDVELFTRTYAGGRTRGKEDRMDLLRKLLGNIPIRRSAGSPKKDIMTPMKTRMVSKAVINPNPEKLDHEDESAKPIFGSYINPDLIDSIESGTKAVIISDYDKGTCYPNLTQRVIETCRRLNIPVFVDLPALEPAKAVARVPDACYFDREYFYRYENAYYLQMNSFVFSLISGRPHVFMDKIGAENLMITKGEKGAAFYSTSPISWHKKIFSCNTMSVRVTNIEPHNSKSSNHPVQNTVGAGDVVIANVAGNVVSGLKIGQAAVKAVHIASDWVYQPRGFSSKVELPFENKDVRANRRKTSDKYGSTSGIA